MAPPLDDEIAASELDAEVRRDLRGLQRETAETVARHLVAAGRLVDTAPQAALEHARYARRRASRIAVVREAAGIVAYHAGEWSEALAELRAARRMGGGPGHLAVIADIERAMGRPERAVELARSPEAAQLDRAEAVELAIVAAGARRDLGELDAAVVGLQTADLDPARRDPWSARLFYAYADNLAAAGRTADAVQWFVHAQDADIDGDTDARRRVAELTGEPLPDEDEDGDGFEFSTEVAPEPDPARLDPAEVESDAAGDNRGPAHVDTAHIATSHVDAVDTDLDVDDPDLVETTDVDGTDGSDDTDDAESADEDDATGAVADGIADTGSDAGSDDSDSDTSGNAETDSDGTDSGGSGTGGGSPSPASADGAETHSTTVAPDAATAEESDETATGTSAAAATGPGVSGSAETETETDDGDGDAGRAAAAPEAPSASDDPAADPAPAAAPRPAHDVEPDQPDTTGPGVRTGTP